MCARCAKPWAVRRRRDNPSRSLRSTSLSSINTAGLPIYPPPSNTGVYNRTNYSIRTLVPLVLALPERLLVLLALGRPVLPVRAGRGRRRRRGQTLQDTADEAADAVVLLVLRDQLATARQRALWQPLEPAPHDAAPELRRQRSAGHLVHRRGIVVAEPYAGHQLGREADEPSVAEVLAGAGLAGGRAAGLRRLAGATAPVRRHHVSHLRQVLFRDHAVARR